MKIWVVIEFYEFSSPTIVRNTGFSSIKDAGDLVETEINKWLTPLHIGNYRQGNAIYNNGEKLIEYFIEPVEFSGCQVQFSP